MKSMQVSSKSPVPVSALPQPADQLARRHMRPPSGTPGKAAYATTQRQGAHDSIPAVATMIVVTMIKEGPI